MSVKIKNVEIDEEKAYQFITKIAAKKTFLRCDRTGFKACLLLPSERRILAKALQSNLGKLLVVRKGK